MSRVCGKNFYPMSQLYCSNLEFLKLWHVICNQIEELETMNYFIALWVDWKN